MADGTRRVIVNADDAGFSPTITRGILTAHRDGIVSSVSLLTNMPASSAAVAALRETNDLGVGIHLNACQGPALSDAGARALAGPDREMHALPASLAARSLVGRRLLDAIEAEFAAQITWALDHGIRPTHLDSHRHVHAWPPIFDRVATLARRFGIRHVRRLCEQQPPGRTASRTGPNRTTRRLLNAAARWTAMRHPDLQPTTGTWGIEHTGAVDVPWLLDALAHLPHGLTEIMVHPGDDDPGPAAATRLTTSRAIERDALCDARVRAALEAHAVTLTHYGRA